MSKRGSFCTEYIYCEHCAAAVRDVLLAAAEEKYFVPVPDPKYPIISGKVGELYVTEERSVFDLDLRDKLEGRICHPVRIAVLCDDEKGDAILRFDPTPVREDNPAASRASGEEAAGTEDAEELHEILDAELWRRLAPLRKIERSRVANALANARISTLAQLREVSAETLLRFKNLGTVSRAKLAALGLLGDSAALAAQASGPYRRSREVARLKRLSAASPGEHPDGRRPMCAGCVARLTEVGVAAFCFMIGPGGRAANWSRPPIASGRWTRGRLASYWPDGFVSVPRELGDHEWSTVIEDNRGWP